MSELASGLLAPGSLANRAPAPARGAYADGFAPLAERFAAQVRDGAEIGAGLTVYHRGRCVVDLHGGLADASTGRPWERDTRLVVFSVTKGLVAMALALLADRGKLDWDAPVASVWPEFAAAGKGAITLRTLFNHEAGLLGPGVGLTLDDCLDPGRAAYVSRVLAEARPLWEPGRAQGYHAISYGLYASEVFTRIAGESVGTFLTRELFAPLGADVSLGTPAEHDARIATLYPPPTLRRVVNMVGALARGDNAESRVLRATLAPTSLVRRAFFEPRVGAAGLSTYNDEPVRRAELAWASATASAHGVARAYLPFALGGSVEGRTYLRGDTLAPVYARQGWSERDLVLQKPLGWSQGFLKEEAHLFSPTPESFGHAGMGGALGWCDPVHGLTFGYVMNRLDWRVRSPRAVALCRALYDSPAVRDARP
jgi:CubicO group peptidase (beta-lactamase class C family)